MLPIRKTSSSCLVSFGLTSSSIMFGVTSSSITFARSCSCVGLLLCFLESRVAFAAEGSWCAVLLSLAVVLTELLASMSFDGLHALASATLEDSLSWSLRLKSNGKEDSGCFKTVRTKCMAASRWVSAFFVCLALGFQDGCSQYALAEDWQDGLVLAFDVHGQWHAL